MKRVKIMAAVTILAVMAAAVSGCGKEKETSSNKNSNTSTTNSIVEEEEYVNCIDMQAMAASIKINDQDMEFPIDITKLKESISLAAVEQTTTNHFYRATLLDGDVDIAVVNLYSESGSVEEDGFIHFLEVTEGSPWYVSVGGITFGASIDEVKAAIGTPIFENGSQTETYRIYYENCSYEYLAFAFEGGILKTISIEYLPQEWRE